MSDDLDELRERVVQCAILGRQRAAKLDPKLGVDPSREAAEKFIDDFYAYFSARFRAEGPP